MWAAVILGFAGGLVAGEREEFFEQHIRPALIKHCYECHSNARGKSEGGLLLDSRPAMQRGGESGSAIKAGRPSESLLIEAIRHESLEMPPGKQLDEATIRLFEEWIRQGAVDPRDKETVPSAASRVDLEAARRFWAFQPRGNVAVPNPESEWGSCELDSFILKTLQANQLQPAPEADRATWLRRVTFDLIGLPPTVDELDAFLADESGDAYEQVVDRLLDSPHYGERWGRYWLDLARYADSNGADENHDYPVAWRYRDYVIAAFNADKPYDRMIHEQLAGDLLPAADEAERRENLTATGFLVLGPKMLAEQDKDKMVADIVDEQLDTIGKVFLGLTLGCARCHDHKFDPITADDYYALAGVFHSTKTMEHLNFVSRWNEAELPDRMREQEIAKTQRPLELAQDEVQELRNVVFARQLALLSELMLTQAGVADANRPLGAQEESGRESPSAEMVEPLAEFLAHGSGLFRVWNKLSRQPSAQFVEESRKQWQALAEGTADEQSTPESNRFELRLKHHSAPASKVELVAVYIAALRQCRNDIADSADDRSLERLLFKGGKAVFGVEREPAAYLSSEEASRLNDATRRIEALTKAMPKLDTVMAAGESKVKLAALHVRGNHLQLSGDPLPRRVPQVLESVGPSAAFPADASGRLELARWLTDPDHPLTARVMVNRIWQGHFGQGLVRSPSNFGMRGDQPTHPELLDWLANDFVRGGWSIKRMHRQIVLSATYRQHSTPGAQAQQLDPENRLLSHFPRRRLELEPIRDSLLLVAGVLDEEMGGEVNAVKGSKYEESEVEKTELDVPRRTIYLPVNRAALNPVFATFDYVDPAVSLEQRPSTIVPHQTLFLMNHLLVMEAGRRLATRVVAKTPVADERIDLTYKSTFARLPTPDERQLAQRFISTQMRSATASEDADPELKAWTSYCRSLLLTSEFLYVD